jgi:putative zinc finger/helix-turn-helix YgiT family protein
MNCIQCGKAQLGKRRERVRGEVRGEEFSVTLPALVCPGCGFTTVEGVDMPEYMRLVADAYRKKHKLLTSDEIRLRRQRLGMSQARFSEYLGVGIASLKRWEMGKVQDASSDELIRLRTNEKAASDNLKRIRRLLQVS